jgi:CheY-like chemotaxis protein
MVKAGKMRVLIVEDEPDIAGLMKHALERGGEMNVEIVGAGAAALKSVMEERPPSPYRKLFADLAENSQCQKPPKLARARRRERGDVDAADRALLEFERPPKTN